MKKIVSISIIFVISYLLCSCSIIYGKVFREIKEQNGDDISLYVLKDDEICAELPKNYCLRSQRKPDGEQSYPQDHEMYGDFLDRDFWEIKTQSAFSGVGSIQITYGKSNQISFTVTSELTSGNLRIVLLNLNSLSILHDFEVNTTETFLLENASEGEYEIRFAGESAICDVSVMREFIE